MAMETPNRLGSANCHCLMLAMRGKRPVFSSRFRDEGGDPGRLQRVFLL
jgi:hypothetical protein